MTFDSGHPLAYPVLTTVGTVAICLAWMPFADSEQLGMVGAVALVVLVYSTFRLMVASGVLPWHTDPGISSAPTETEPGDSGPRDTEPADSGPSGSESTDGRANAPRCRRIRQQHRLLSRSWLELTAAGRTRWLPVYFDPFLVTATDSTVEFRDGTVFFDNVRLYPSGPVRDREPIGRLHDNPTRPDPDGPAHAADASRFTRRLLLDGQYVVVAPFAALLWVYVAGGGFPAFLGAVTVAAGVAVWFSAIRGSDPS
ncbi:hypothetical protein [Nocardia vaccinii]|uniref:hypothetical protein n=1 Tax=Nocardia vaccinii TaxID=1822 RepID=UPI00082BA26D|nr:hypothetical protein [Nocardia vaccinii]